MGGRGRKQGSPRLLLPLGWGCESPFGEMGGAQEERPPAVPAWASRAAPSPPWRGHAQLFELLPL